METATAHEPAVEDDLQGLMAGLRVPATVAAVTYPRGCRIRRVRVKAPKATGTTGDKRRPVIVSRRALRGSREDDELRTSIDGLRRGSCAETATPVRLDHVRIV